MDWIYLWESLKTIIMKNRTLFNYEWAHV